MGAEILASVERRMVRVIEAMDEDFERLRAGRATAALVEGLRVEGGRTIGQVAGISVPDPRQIVIQPWDRSILAEIAKAITQSGIGISPTVDGSAVRLYFPALTEERRRELIGLVHKRMEQARIELRGLRHEAAAAIAKEKRSGGVGADATRRELELVARLTERFSAEVDRRGRTKEQRILER